MARQASQLIREGAYAAEVIVDLHDDGGEWSPTISLDDIRKLDRVRQALRNNKPHEAEKEALVFTLVPYADQSPSAATGFAEIKQDELKP